MPHSNSKLGLNNHELHFGQAQKTTLQTKLHQICKTQSSKAVKDSSAGLCNLLIIQSLRMPHHKLYSEASAWGKGLWALPHLISWAEVRLALALDPRD